jgi:pectate lyase
MLPVRIRSFLFASRSRLLTAASGLCLLPLLVQGCGSASNEGSTDTGASAGVGAAGSAASSAGGHTSQGGTSSMASGGTSNGGTSNGGTLAAGGAGGSGATTGGSAATAGTTGMAGGTSMAGAGGSSSGSCTVPPPGSALLGWASQSGMGVTTTTGGGNAAPQTVTTLAQLTSAVAGNTAKVIYVTGKLSAGKIAVGSNKTIIGLCGAEVHGHIGLSGSANVIIRNLKIVGYGVGNCALDPDYDASVGCSSGNDAVTINNSAHHIWVDHCDISDGTDGNLDTTQGADFVTVSWTKFHYTPRTDPTGNDSTGAEGHRFSNLIGGADNVPGDAGHLNITFHHDWWADNVNQRMPRSRAGKIHLLNNLFTAKGDSYCSNAGQGAALLVENTIYSGVKAPFQIDANAVGLVSKGNLFPNSTGTTTGSGSAFTPPYSYTPDSTNNLQADIQANAGPQ